MRLGLRSRVALAFGVLSLLVAIVIAGTLYALARVNLVAQRESAALTRALLDARAVGAALSDDVPPADAIAGVPSVGTSLAMVNVDGEWFTRGVTVAPSDLPAGLLDLAGRTGGARQYAVVGRDPYLVIALTADRGVYVELFPLRELDTTLRAAGWLLVGSAVVAFAAGALVGRAAGSRVLLPLRRLAAGARRLAGGDLSVRLPPNGDPDLDPIATAFNDMAVAVQSRIARERRFVANVSHELRSPLTTVVGTAELLERHTDRFPPRDAGLVRVLVRQARRLSSTLLDLLEISRIGEQVPIQDEVADLRSLAAQVLRDRGLPESLLRGDVPQVRTDARRVERIVANLVDNAERHGGGVVQVLIERVPGRIRISVDDAGPGIDPDEADRIFEPFARGAGAAGTEGAGLGLALVREQGQLLGGTVTVGRAPAGGARFTLDLPSGPS